MKNTWQYLNTVTTLSKILAAALFIMLPVLSLWIGYGIGLSVGRAQSSILPSQLELTPTPIDPLINITPEITETIIPELGKSITNSYVQTVLPWQYSFKYPSDWSVEEQALQDNSLSAIFAKEQQVCASGEVICSMVMGIDMPAEWVDSAVSTYLYSEPFILNNEGEATILTYSYRATGKHYHIINIRNGWIMVNVNSGMDNEALTLFKQILSTYTSEEAAEAR